MSTEERTESPRQGGEGKQKTLQEMSGQEREEAIKKKQDGVPFLHQLVDEGQDAMTDSQKAIYERMKTTEQKPYAGPKTRSFSLRPSVTARSGSIDASATSADTAKSYTRFSSFDADSILGDGGTSFSSGARFNGAGIKFESGAQSDDICFSAPKPDLLSSITQSCGGDNNDL